MSSSVFLPKLNSFEEAGLFAAGELRIDVAHVVEALGAVAVFDGEAAAVEGQADAAPGAVEAVVDLQGRPAAGRRRARRADRAGATPAGDRRSARGFFLGAQLDHQARQQLGLELRVGRARLPDGLVLALADVDFHHAAVLM